MIYDIYFENNLSGMHMNTSDAFETHQMKEMEHLKTTCQSDLRKSQEISFIIVLINNIGDVGPRLRYACAKCSCFK